MPTKENSAGKQQPYDAKTGKFASSSNGVTSDKIEKIRSSIEFMESKNYSKEDIDKKKKQLQFEERYEEQKQKARDKFFGEGNVKDVSNKYFKFKRVLDDNNIIITTNNVEYWKGKEAYVMYVDKNKVVFLKDWQVLPVHNDRGSSSLDGYAVKLNRNYFKPYKLSFESEKIFDKEENFDDLYEIAKSQDKENMEWALKK